MAKHWDVIVVGAGPGGSTAAFDLASAGASVFLLDRARFPRDKPCGGGVLLSAARSLPFSLDPVTEQTIHAFRVRYRRSWEFEHRYDKPLALMTQRARLDAYLAEQATLAGADFRDGIAVRGVIGTKITTSHGDAREVETHTADVIIAADGANSVVRRALGLPRLRAAVALEGNADRVQQHAGTRWTDAVGLELGTMPGGYSWVFPKDDHCNVGVGGFSAVGATLRDQLSAYASVESFDAATLSGLRGHHLPLRDPDSDLIVGRVAFVGDAAGLVDPLSGEGIGNAIRSGQLVAAATLELLSGRADELSAYQLAIESEIEPELRVARQLQALFHLSPWPYVQLLRRSERFWRAFCRIVCGESTYTQFQSRLGPASVLVDLAAAFANRRQREDSNARTDSKASSQVARSRIMRW